MKTAPLPGEETPRLSAVVVHWGDPALVAELAAAWPDDARFQLLVVDNGPSSSDRPALPNLPGLRGGAGRVLSPGTNLGFAGGANAGVAAARGEIVLLLNPDAVPEPGALEALLRGFAEHPEAAGLAPRLVGPEGEAQWPWQLRRLPGPAALLAQVFFLSPGGVRREPESGARVAQPAAAALALKRSALDAVGGLDAGFYPAWFEDVDLARRLGDAGLPLLYYPEARFRHRLGSSVPHLGYGPFLWIYQRNLVRYLAKHHGAVWALMARALLVPALVTRILLLPLRRPRRAPGRGAAAAALAAAALGAASGWRRPRAYARRFPPAPDGGTTSTDGGA